MNSTITYITTSIPYVNAAPHVGFAFELVQTDAYARCSRLLGNDVRLGITFPTRYNAPLVVSLSAADGDANDVMIQHWCFRQGSAPCGTTMQYLC